MANFCYEMGQEGYFIKTEKAGMSRSGTGDIFSQEQNISSVTKRSTDLIRSFARLLKVFLPQRY